MATSSSLTQNIIFLGCFGAAGAFMHHSSSIHLGSLGGNNHHSSLTFRTNTLPLLKQPHSIGRSGLGRGLTPMMSNPFIMTNPGYKGIGVYLTPLPLVAFKWNTVFALLLYITGKYKSALTLQGLIHSYILGCILWGTLGLGGWSTCVVYLLSGSIATKIKKAEKEAKGIAEGRGGQRGPENVWGSAATAAICAILAVFSPFDSIIFKVGFAASLATKLSDTMASEIGKAFGKTTYLITTMKTVPPGTEGAVSVEGTLAGVVGSIILATYAYLVNIIDPLGALLCVFAAFVATNIESVIGATAQGKYKWLTNEVVNFINTAIGAAVAMFLYTFWPW